MFPKSESTETEAYVEGQCVRCLSLEVEDGVCMTCGSTDLFVPVEEDDHDQEQDD